MRVQGTIPRALADDLTTISIGDDACETTIAALYATYEYLNAVGGKVRIQKTWAFASDTNIRKRLADIKFPNQQHIALAAAHEHRDLGGHLDFTKRRTGTTLTRRIVDATKQTKALAHLAGPHRHKHRLIVTELRP